MHHIYSNDDLSLIDRYRVSQKAASSNKRFTERIITLDILNALKRLNFKCHYCSEPLQADSWQLDHFHSKAMGGKNEPSNLAPSCKWCNQMKNALDGNAFLVRCKKIVFANLNTDLPSATKKNEFTPLKDFPINLRYSFSKSEQKNNPELSKILLKTV